MAEHGIITPPSSRYQAASEVHALSVCPGTRPGQIQRFAAASYPSETMSDPACLVTSAGPCLNLSKRNKRWNGSWEEGSSVSIRVPDGTEVRADAVRIPDVRYQSLDQLLDHPMVQEVITNGTDKPRKVSVAAFNSAI